MAEDLDEVLRRTTIFRRLTAEDRQRLATVSNVRAYDKGVLLFGEGDAPDQLYTIVSGRVKVFKTTARGSDVILEIFGPGDPVGAVAVYEGDPIRPARSRSNPQAACSSRGRRSSHSSRHIRRWFAGCWSD